MHLWWIPFLVQGLVISFDEFYFHLKRGLPKWERIGHPIDTLSLLLCLGFILWVPYSKISLPIYIALSIFSCLLVTKDEWVHKEHCGGKEQWLHALLFLNHPLVLISVGIMWANIAPYRLFLGVQSTFVALFFSFQIIYWNFVWKETS